MTSPGKSNFDLTHVKKLTTKMGLLVPILTLDLVPSDKINISEDALVRLAPMIAPPYHRVDVTFQRFFVPNRLVWTQWDALSRGYIPIYLSYK